MSRRSTAPAAALIADQPASASRTAPPARGAGTARRVWRGLWPRLATGAIVLLAWQSLVWTGWRPDYVLPGPIPVFQRLWEEARSGTLFDAVRITLQRAAIGYAIALVIGVALGLTLAWVPVLRRGAGSLVAGLQSMPSVAWFPLAILLFQLSEGAIVFVVVLGAAPAIAVGLMSAIDTIPPLMLRAGRVLGAGRIALYRHVILPAALPGFVGGLKQGWAFAWRSLMAGELLVIVAGHPSVGARLQFAREFSDAEGLLAWMCVVLILGILVDTLIFSPIERTLLEHRGLVSSTAEQT